jgi:hypothetical protein
MTTPARALIALVLASLAIGGSSAGAQTLVRTLPNHRAVAAPSGVTPPGKPKPYVIPPHTVYGQIARLSATSFLLKLRSGRLLTVDDSVAVASGHYSAPLFVGKYVEVAGSLGTTGVLVAETITRMQQIDPSNTRADR